jgi:hypothetical protein
MSIIINVRCKSTRKEIMIMEKQERNKYLEILKELLELRSAIENRLRDCKHIEEYVNEYEYSSLCYSLYKEIDTIMEQLKSDIYVDDYWIEKAENAIRWIKQRFTALITRARGKKNA